MRFSAAIQPHPMLSRPPAAAEFLRRLFESGQTKNPEPPPVLRTDDLPTELDQRVRLLGEW